MNSRPKRAPAAAGSGNTVTYAPTAHKRPNRASSGPSAGGWTPSDGAGDVGEVSLISPDTPKLSDPAPTPQSNCLSCLLARHTALPHLAHALASPRSTLSAGRVAASEAALQDAARPRLQARVHGREHTRADQVTRTRSGGGGCVGYAGRSGGRRYHQYRVQGGGGRVFWISSKCLNVRAYLS